MSRPSDAIERAFESDEVEHPRLGPVEWLRWAWRQLTSMRTALLLLLALAIAAVPGSLIPQESADPNGVIQWKASNPGLVHVVDFLQGFDVYSSVWFSAIYLLLFVSLVGCVVPRVRHHWRALRARPPRTPARFDKLPASRSAVSGGTAEQALVAAEQALRRRRYRTTRYGDSVSAERGYLRESGNLLFHSALVGVLIAVFVGGGFTFTGSKVIAVGQTFVNSQVNYDTLSTGRFFGDNSMQPYALTLKSFEVAYSHQAASFGQPVDYTAQLIEHQPNEAGTTVTLKVNSPLSINGTEVYLLGNGYAPVVTVRNADGSIAFQGAVPFRPDGNAQMESVGVIKAQDTSNPKRQLGFQGFLYPTAVKVGSTLQSEYAGLGSPLVALNVYVGSLGGADGTPQNIYTLDTSEMKQVAGFGTAVQAVELTRANPAATLPDGLGTIHLDGITRFVSLDVHHDPAQSWVATFVALAVAGLIVSLLVPRRRMWVRVQEAEGAVQLEYAGLARGDDPGLDRAVQELAADHVAALPAPTDRPAPSSPHTAPARST